MCYAVAVEKSELPLQGQPTLSALKCCLQPVPAAWVMGNGSAPFLALRPALHPPAVLWSRLSKPWVPVEKSLAKLRGFYLMVKQSHHSAPR